MKGAYESNKASADNLASVAINYTDKTLIIKGIERLIK